MEIDPAAEPAAEPLSAARAFPPWPAWYAPVGFLASIIGAGMLGVLLVLGAALAAPAAEDGPELVIAGTLIQDVVFLAVAVGFAAMTLRPRAWHFGLRGARFWRAAGWSVAGLLAFYIFGLLYGALIGEPEPQTTLEDLGVDRGGIYVLIGAVLVIVIAPLVEEVFFRGFFYRALRNHLPAWWAILISALLFGSLHLLSGPEAVPPLIFLGAVLCLVYERTGSLYPVIGMHAFNNALAFGVGIEALTLPLVLGSLMIGLCMILVARSESQIVGLSLAASERSL